MESQLQSKIIKHLKEQHGAYILNIHGGGFMPKGAPDIVVCYKGHYIAIETKVFGNKPQPAQLIHKARIERAGGKHMVPYSFDQYVEQFNKIKEELENEQ